MKKRKNPVQKIADLEKEKAKRKLRRKVKGLMNTLAWGFALLCAGYFLGAHRKAVLAAIKDLRR